jgi:hypothetical protein
MYSAIMMTQKRTLESMFRTESESNESTRVLKKAMNGRRGELGARVGSF